MAYPGTKVKNRIRYAFVFVCVAFVAAALRLGYLQIVKAGELQAKAESQWTSDLVVAAKRGDILDRNGEVLAMSASAEMVTVRPKEVQNFETAEEKSANVEKVVQAFVDVLGMDEEAVSKKVKDTTKSEVLIKRQLTKEVAQQLKELDLKGVYLSEDTKRYYPMENYLCQVLGYTNTDGAGQAGLEAKYDKYLAGTPGRVVVETDKNGNTLPNSVEQRIEPVDGYDLQLTIDYAIQSFADRAMEQALEEQGAKSAMAIAMDPDTGDILALSIKPDFDNNNPPRDDLEQLNSLSRNIAVTNVYDPGSTFKIITTAMGLESGKYNTGSHFFCPGYHIVDGQKIKCWRSYNPHGSQTLVEGVKNSCNPVFMQIALGLGKETFYDYLDKFGFGKTTGVDFSGEESGIVTAEKYVKDVDLACMGFGQSISVTPIQLITAVSAAINGGNLMQPHFVHSVLDADGNAIQVYEPEVVNRAISEETSETLRGILEQVVKDGSGHNAYIPGYRIGGKTGTSQKVVDGKVSSQTHIGSFIGFAPADDPQIVVLVVVDEPSTGSHFGSVVAAPYAKEILGNSLKYLGVQPVYEEGESEQQEQVDMPEVVGKTLEEARAEVEAAGLQVLVEGTGGTVTDTLPKGGVKVDKNNSVLLYMSEDGGEDETELITVPRLTDLSLVDATMQLYNLGLEIEVEGRGLVVSQEPAAGEKVAPKSTVKVKLENP